LGADVTVREDHLHCDGVDYFRGRAGAVQLGDVGERRDPAGGPGHLAVRARLPRDQLAIDRVTQVDLHGVTVRGSDIAADITVAEVGSLGASTVARLLHDQTLGLIKLEAGPRAVIDAANECAGPLDALGRAGKAGRLVHQVFVIVETATLEDLGDGRTKLVSVSLFHTSWERDGMLGSGMEGGMNESYAALDRVLAAMA